MNKSQSHIYDLEYESVTIGDVQYIRDHKAIWRYGETWIPVPGARDLTLTEHFEPKQVISSDGTIERVIVSGESIRESPELLEWCVDAGDPRHDSDGNLIEVFVPHSTWKERDRVPGKLVAPEHSAKEAERALANAERVYREADQARDDASEARAEVLRKYSERITRERAHAITGLSVGRIQQLIRREKLTELELSVLDILNTGDGMHTDAIQELAIKHNPRSSAAAIDQVLRSLLERHLIKRKGPRILLTEDGRAILPSARSPGKARRQAMKAG